MMMMMIIIIIIINNNNNIAMPKFVHNILRVVVWGKREVHTGF
jgi:hypothetical protein